MTDHIMDEPDRDLRADIFGHLSNVTTELAKATKLLHGSGIGSADHVIFVLGIARQMVVVADDFLLGQRLDLISGVGEGVE